MKRIITYLVCGALGGVLGGMGMGGGTLLIPLLATFTSLGQHASQAVNLVAFVPMSIAAIIIHAKNGLIKIKGLWLFILVGAAFGVLGSFIGKNIDGGVLRKIFGGFLMALAIVQLFSDKIVKSISERRETQK